MSPTPGDRVITCVLPKGGGKAVLQALFDRGVLRAVLGAARAPIAVERGRGAFTRLAFHSVEKDVLTVIAGGGEADELFAFVHERAAIADSHGGFMFMAPLSLAGAFALPDLPSTA